MPRHTKESYLALRESGKTAEDIAAEWGMSRENLQKNYLWKWGIRENPPGRPTKVEAPESGAPAGEAAPDSQGAKNDAPPTVADAPEDPAPTSPEPPRTVYLSGPMTGCPDLNYPAFFAAESFAQAQGFLPINPARDAPEGWTWTQYMRRSLRLLTDADEIWMLPGWEQSRGARLEHTVAAGLELRIRFLRMQWSVCDEG